MCKIGKIQSIFEKNIVKDPLYKLLTTHKYFS